MNSEGILSAVGVGHAYLPRYPVLRNVSLNLSAGEIVHLSGANGSGKTTLIKILAGLIRPLTGRIKGGERSLFLPDSLLYGDLTLGENLNLYRNLLGTKKTWQEKLIECLQLGEMLPRFFKDLSRGQKIRGALCRVFMASAPVYLLDEPATGLDDVSTGHLASIIAELKKEGKTVLFSTHHDAGLSGLIDRRFRIEAGELSEEKSV